MITKEGQTFPTIHFQAIMHLYMIQPIISKKPENFQLKVENRIKIKKILWQLMVKNILQ